MKELNNFQLLKWLFLLNLALNVSASNIVFFHLGATASHRTSIWPLATKLADSGHKITYIFTSSKRPGSHPLIEELKPSTVIKANDNLIGDFDINVRLNGTINEWTQAAFGKMSDLCAAFYGSPETHEWLARPGLKYDLFMLDGGFSQCAYPLVHRFKAKHILFNVATLPGYWDPFGIVPETSSIPELLFSVKPDQLQTSLLSRALNTLAMLAWRIGYYDDAIAKMEATIRNKLNLTDMPSFEEIEPKTSLVFHNAYFIEDYPMSLPPMYISYSGLLCTKKSIAERQSLPERLKSFIEDGSEGFVYVSFGSSVIASAMPETLRNEFMRTFAAFPKLKFLWRWTGPIPENTPDNVLLQSWFPQLDILAHPKIKAFVMQGGRPSIQEALCYGVPMIAMPFFADQDFNAHRLEQIGAAIELDITSLNADTLIRSLNEVVNGTKYRKRVKQLSSMFRDRPMDPVENALYWVEYALRHDTSLMKPLGMNQTWWQRRLLDVYAVILIFVLTLCSIVGLLLYVFVKWIVRIVPSSNQGKHKTD